MSEPTRKLELLKEQTSELIADCYLKLASHHQGEYAGQYPTEEKVLKGQIDVLTAIYEKIKLFTEE